MGGLLGEEMQIEIDLNKIERGTHEGRVKVTRGGKTFYRKQRVGVKKKPETDKKLDFVMGDMEGDNEIAIFKKSLETKNVGECISVVDEIFRSNKVLTDVYEGWYAGSARMTLLERVANDVFGLSSATSRPRPFLPPSARKTEENFNRNAINTKDFLKSYYVNQAILNKEHPDGFIEVYRGVSGEDMKGFFGKEKGEHVSLNYYNLSSWSEDRNVAAEFSKKESGIVIKAKIPNYRILMQHKGNTIGIYLEKEAIVIGSHVDGEIDEIIEIHRKED